jgi:hypothetical protein
MYWDFMNYLKDFQFSKSTLFVMRLVTDFSSRMSRDRTQAKVDKVVLGHVCLPVLPFHSASIITSVLHKRLSFDATDIRRTSIWSLSTIWQKILLWISGSAGQEYMLIICLFVCLRRDHPQWAKASSFKRFLDHTQRRTTVGRTPLDEWSARRRDLYQTTHNTQQQTNIHAPVGLEPTTSAGERSQAYVSDRVSNGNGSVHCSLHISVSATNS